MKRISILSFVLCFCIHCQAQFIETFSGKTLTDQHPWAGDIQHFRITPSGELYFFSPKKDNIRRVIHTPVQIAENTTWMVDIKTESLTTSSNYLRIYLSGYNSRDKESIYYLQIGSTDGSLRLYQEKDKPELLIASRPLVRDLRYQIPIENYIRTVIRLENNEWSFYTNTPNEQDFTLEGKAQSTASFQLQEKLLAIETVNVKSRENIYYLDNIYIYPEAVGLPPTLSSKGELPTLPTLTDIEPVSYNTVRFLFSAPVDIQQANFSISDIGVAERMQYGETEDIVQARFGKEMVPGKEYQISWKGVKAKDGRNVEDGSWQVRLDEEENKEQGNTPSEHKPSIYQVGDILISEIMADPKGNSSLPETEYIEILNTSTKNIELKGWNLTYGKRKVKFTEGVLPAATYAVLYREGREIHIDKGGIKLPLPTFPASLANAGKEISLLDPTEKVIDTVTYTKATPGKSWERGSNNEWHLSTDPRGGTPGSRNSAKQEENPEEEQPTLPELRQISPLSPSTLQFVFTGLVNISQATFTVEGIRGPHIIEYGESDSVVILRLKKEMSPKKEYTIRWKGVKSKDGRKLKDGSQSIYYEGKEEKEEEPKEPITYEVNDILINEIMADPSELTKLPQTEYIELFNTTDNCIDLSGWNLLYGGRTIPINQGTLPAKSYALLYRTERDIHIDAGGINLPLVNFPASLANTGKELALTDPTKKVIDTVTYSKATPGKSRERGSNNEWHLSTDPRGGTPGSSNSAKQEESPEEEQPALPELSQVSPLSPFVLQLVFTGSVNISQASFTIEGMRGPHTIEYGESDSIVILGLKKEMSPKKEYTIRWKGLKSKDGRKLKDGSQSIYFEGKEEKEEEPKEVITYEVGDILINEVMADPNGLTKLPQTEYIELFNATDSCINLSSWHLLYGGRTIPIKQGTLPAKSYALLYRAERDIHIDAGGINLPLVTFPASLANTGKELALTDPTEKVIDAVTYSKATPGQSWERDRNNQWHLSSDPRGGTPGSVNSLIVSDPESPEKENSTLIEPFEIIINELLPEPHLEASEYIELYNRSDKSISLHSLAITTLKSNGRFRTAYPLAKLKKTLLPGEYIALTSEKEGVINHYLNAPTENIFEVKLPILANSSSTVVLYRQSDSTVIDRVSYSSTWHHKSIKLKKGVSLERIDPDAPSDQASNWTSASSLQEYGTPGYQNSQYMKINSSSSVSQEEDEQIELTNDYHIIYRMSKEGFVCNARLFDLSGRLIENIMKDEHLDISGEIIWHPHTLIGEEGIYIFSAELHHPDGDRKRIQKVFLNR